jgi:hypothetical protein
MTIRNHMDCMPDRCLVGDGQCPVLGEVPWPESKPAMTDRDHGWQEGYEAGMAHAQEMYGRTWAGRLDDLRKKVEADRADLNAKIDRAHLKWPIDHEQVNAWSCERVALNRVLAMLKGEESLVVDEVETPWGVLPVLDLDKFKGGAQ